MREDENVREPVLSPDPHLFVEVRDDFVQGSHPGAELRTREGASL